MKQFVLVVMLAAFARATEFQFYNKLPGEVWVGCLGNPGHDHLNNGGWRVGPGVWMSVTAPDNWAGRFWGRTGCNPDTSHCVTGDCGNRLQCNGNGGVPPVTLAEITLNGDRGLDYYHISVVEGFNGKMAMEPLGGVGDGSLNSCKRTACTFPILSECPQQLQVKNSRGIVVGCNSACNAFHTDEYCCTETYNKPETCKSTDWPVNYPKFFKDRCPDAYSYAYDDHKSTFTCNAPIYLVTFGA